MTRYLGRRLLQAVFVLWAAFTVTFGVLFLLPSDPVSIALDAGGSGTYVDPAVAQALRVRLGLDQPLWHQYLSSLWHALQGNLGTSVATGTPVTHSVLTALPKTLALAGTALGIAVVLGVGVALAATYTRSRLLSQVLLSLPPLGVSVPVFWVGLILLQVFSFRLGLFPAFGDSGGATLVLPAVALALPTSAVIGQVLATSLQSTWRQPFIETARSKGASRWRIHTRHALRIASIPALTLAGIVVGNLLAGSVVVETVFSRNGVGRLTQSAVSTQDLPVVQGLVVLAALVFVLVNLAVDLVYPLVDPRITRSAASVS